MAPLKFPTAASPFPQVELTDGDCRLYEQRAATLVANALAEYDEYTELRQRQVDKKQWRAVKTRENLTVYRERSSRSTNNSGDGSTSSDNSSATGTPKLASTMAATLALGATKIGGWFKADKESGDWSLPTLLAVGSIAGTLDDVMYGISTFDSTAMFLKSTYTDNQLVDGEVLYSIKTPTPEEPYQFVGLKWIVKGQPMGMKNVLWPRDVVYLESTGIVTRPNGEHIGYQLIHSVNLAECDELRSRGVLRATMSSCFLFKQLPKGAVDVYMKAHVEPNGKVSNSIALKSTASSLIYCWKSVSCAQRKKLAWKLQMKERQQQYPDGTTTSTATVPSRRGSQISHCGICSKSIGKFRHAVKCELCDAPVCSKCRVHKRLSFKGSWAKHVVRRSALFCTKCIAHTNQLDAFAVARDEVVAGRWEEGAVSKDEMNKSDASNHLSSPEHRRSSERTTTAWHSSDLSMGGVSTASSGVYSVADPDSFAKHIDDGTSSTYSSFHKARSDSDWKHRFSHSFDITAPILEPRFQEVDFDYCVPPTDELDGMLESEFQYAHTTSDYYYNPSSIRSTQSSASSYNLRVPVTPGPVLTHQEQLWLQMSELRTQAESIYQITQKNAESHLNSSRSTRSMQFVN